MPPPTISSIDGTDESPTAGGVTVILNGTNLDTVTDVVFFDAGTTACSFVVDGPTQITIASMPAHARAIGYFLVTNPSGNGLSSDPFTYEDSDTAPRVSSLSPDTGDIAGGTNVTILGFQFTGATDVEFGGASADAFVFVDDSQIQAVSPTAGFAHGVYVKVIAGGEDSPVGIPAVFIYTAVEPPPPVASDCIALSIGDFLADTVTADANAICYTVEKIDGWYDSPPVRVGTSEAQPRGEHVNVAQTLGRPIVVEITAHALDRTVPLGAVLCFTAMETIKAAFQVVFVPADMRVIDPAFDRHALVRRDGPIKQNIVGESVTVHASIPLFAEVPELVTT